MWIDKNKDFLRIPFGGQIKITMMMILKQGFVGFLALVILGLFSSVGASPFGQAFVCVPSLDPSAAELEFTIQSGGPCVEGATWRRVVTEPDGTIKLLPSQGPLPQEDQRSLEEYKRFYGIDP